MLTFMHTYDEGWESIQKAGLFREGDGLKIMHKTYYPDEYRFNRYGAMDSPLYRTLEQLRCPFYIDRVLGGIGLPWWYNYDMALLERYRELLGENFWGFQIHEWSSNYKNEGIRILDALHAWQVRTGNSGDVSSFWAEILKDPQSIFTEAFTPDEWSRHTYPLTLDAYLDNICHLYQKRLRMTGSPLIPVDSYHLAPRIEIAHGAKILMPEIGWQIPDMRLTMAYTRGMANASGIRFGIYYECWGGNYMADIVSGAAKMTIPYSVNTYRNEWRENNLLRQMKNAMGEDHPLSDLENGGSSRSLQERVWRYAYLSGATVIGEEYGVCNTFYDYQDASLSQYGRVKKDFLSFAEKYPHPGKPYTPFAIVLPADIPVLELANDTGRSFLGYPYAGEAASSYGNQPIDPVRTQKLETIRGVLSKLFAMGSDGLGNEHHVIRNGKYPDVFDIIHADMPEAIARYPYVIDATGDTAFAANHPNVVSSDELDTLLLQLLPCQFSDNVHYMFNRTDDGWLVLVMNNNGVERCWHRGDCFLPKATITSRMTLRKTKTDLRILEGSCSLVVTGGQPIVTLGAGQWLLLQLSES